jgi:hypothetical protein
MKKKLFLAVMLGMVLAFGLVVVGCADGNGDSRVFSVTAHGPTITTISNQEMSYDELYAFATSYGIQNASVTFKDGSPPTTLFPWITELDVGYYKDVTWSDTTYLKVYRIK